MDRSRACVPSRPKMRTFVRVLQTGAHKPTPSQSSVNPELGQETKGEKQRESHVGRCQPRRTSGTPRCGHAPHVTISGEYGPIMDPPRVDNIVDHGRVAIGTDLNLY